MTDMKMMVGRMSAVLLAGTCSFTAFAQGQSLSGTVKDASGEPLIGVSVKVKDGKAGAVTDFDGNFKLTGVKPGATLVFSYIGYRTREVRVENAKQPLSVTLEEDTKTLDEVVVIGYGTVQKRDLTGSVSSVKAEDLANVPVANVTEALSGKLAGVNITTTEGSPDADVKIRVRGGGSLSQDNSPLYIVDGFPVSSISDIAPSEIESIDVLKDASSTAIYGARGANGVIIVTTKSGREGKTQVDFGASYGWKKVTKMTKVLNPYDYAYYQWEQGNQTYGNFEDLEIWRSVPGTDYQDEIFGRTGNQLQYNLNVSGGNKDLTYNVSYSHSDENSIMLASGYRKDNVNAKLKSELNKWLSLDFNARLSYSVLDGLSGGADTNESNAATSIVFNAARFAPVRQLSEDTDNTEDAVSTRRSPLERLLATWKKRRRLQQNYNVGLNWKPFKGFTFRSEFGYRWDYDDTEQAWGSDATANSRWPGMGQPQHSYNHDTGRTWRNANTLTYDNRKLFGGRDRINVLLGHEVNSSTGKDKEIVSVNYPVSMTIDEVLANTGLGTPYLNNTTIDADDNLLSFFGRVNYTLADNYLFTVAVRADGSSKFADGNRWGVFPSAAFAWRLSDEKFMAGTKGWLSNLKLRLSYGTAGNNRIKSGLIYTTYSAAGSANKFPYFGETQGNMIELGRNLYNPSLKWETTITRNVGVDWGFWNNRLSGSLDFYWNTTRDLLMQAEIPSNTGYNYQYQNMGQTSNKGVELTLNAVILDTKQATLNFTANVAYNRNRIDKLASENPWSQNYSWSGSNIEKYENFPVEEGGRVGEVWGYRTNGFFTAYDPVTNPTGELIMNGTGWVLKDGVRDNSASITGGALYPGGLKLVTDADGNPVKQRLGNTVAPWTGGFGLNGTLGNFDFNAFFNYSLGGDIINGTKLITSFFAGTSPNYNLNDDFALGKRYTWIDPANGMNLARPNSQVLDTYGGERGIINRLNELNAGASTWSPVAVTRMQLIDYAVEDASFLRLNNLTVGYTLPKAWVKKAFLQNVRLYFTGYNLFCWTGYSGADPEVDTSSRKNPLNPGIDYAAYPKSRSYVGGINISF